MAEISNIFQIANKIKIERNYKNQNGGSNETVLNFHSENYEFIAKIQKIKRTKTLFFCYYLLQIVSKNSEIPNCQQW